MNKDTTTQEKIICTDTTGFFDDLAGVRIKINQNTEKWGLIDKTGEFVIPPVYDTMFYIGGKYVDVGIINHESHEEEILWGIVDLNNNIKIPFEYIEPDVNFAGELSNKRFVMKERYDCEQTEILDCNGKIIARHDDIFSINNKHIFIKNNGKTGCISPQNKILVPCIFDNITCFETLSKIEYNQRTYTVNWKKLRSFTRYYWLIKTIDKTCNITFDNLKKRWQLSQWNNGEKFSLQIFHRHRKIIKEKFDIHIKYDEKTGICNIEKVRKNGKDFVKMWLEENHRYKHLVYQYKSLELICTTTLYLYDRIDYAEACFTEQVLGSVNKWGLIDKKRQLVIPPIYDAIHYNGGVHVFVSLKTVQDSEDSEKWGIIDLNNKIIVPFKYDKLEPSLCDNYSVFPAKYQGKWGIINKIGNVIIPFEYEDIWENEEYYQAQKDGKWGLLSKSDEILIPFEYDDSFQIWDNNFIVRKNGKCGSISREGEILISLIYDDFDLISKDSTFRAFRSGEEWFFLNQEGERILF